MINFRKLKQDLSPSLLKEGQALYKENHVSAVKIAQLSPSSVKLNASVLGNFENHYSCDLEIDSKESCLIDSDCDCPYKYDCVHLAAVLFHLEDHFNQLLLGFSKENKAADLKGEEKEELLDAIKEVKQREEIRQGKKYDKELVEEYLSSGDALAKSPFFIPEEKLQREQAELVIILSPPAKGADSTWVEAKLALRVPYRSKPLHLPNAKEFLDAVRYGEPLYIGSRRYLFTMSSFSPEMAEILKMIIDFGRFPAQKEERFLPIVLLETEALGALFAHLYDLIYTSSRPLFGMRHVEGELVELPAFAIGVPEEPLKISTYPVELQVEIDYLEMPAPKISFKPSLHIGGGNAVSVDEGILFQNLKPGLLLSSVYYRFSSKIKRRHLGDLELLRNIIIPEPLFGTFVENALPELARVSQVVGFDVTKKFVTLPFTGELGARCDIHFLDGELEASLHFIYDDIEVPAAHAEVKAKHILPFVSKEGILARNLTDEERIIQDLFQGFSFEPKTGSWVVKSDKKIVEFMTEVVPRFSKKVTFNCPKNLLDKFIYDETKFSLKLRESKTIDCYAIELQVKGHLEGFTVDQLWDCIATKRTFIELKKKKGEESGQAKVLVLDLERLAPIVQLFDEIGLTKLSTHVEERPLWSLASIRDEEFEALPVAFSISDTLKKIRSQMLGEIPVDVSPIPKEVKAELHGYQVEGIGWLERLRKMHLSGILADDMGLGKTVQAIAAISQLKKENPKAKTIVVCPTSLVYNWHEELHRFNPKLKAEVIDGTPPQRKKLIEKSEEVDILITSYTLLQKDIEHYEKIPFGYAILDEAQHIKNRGTRNAKSVKMLKAMHRLILTGTPIENSLDELWSLFDYLMPGLLSTYERFSDKYIRQMGAPGSQSLELLRRKVSPFILRRMKKDVLEELPPVSHIVYHCHLTPVQEELYRSYASSARKELSKLVEKEGFNKVQIQILATLTRLKQICCHPAIFAKEKAETGDSAKYEMLLDLLETLIASKRKTVVFSQYTRMLQIMRKDLEQRGVRFCYLDGATKERMSIVKEFNEDPSITVFLVSLKAGGTGLNLVGADSVIHYDPWWNPAAEDQATDRVHRIGQKNNVSAYKLVTKNTIEEKIQEMQARKRGLVKKVISSDEEALAKLTWDEVLELLKT